MRALWQCALRCSLSTTSWSFTLLRSAGLDNESSAAASLSAENPCVDCSAPCECACVKAGEVSIKKLVTRFVEEVRPCLDVELPKDETALTAGICGVWLENPFLLSSSVVAST